MKNHLRIFKNLTVLLLASQLFVVGRVVAQTITLIPSPPVKKPIGYSYGFIDASDGNSAFTPIVTNNMLYGPYTDVNNKGHLSKFDGTKLTVIANPDKGKGVFGQLVAFNGAVYASYKIQNDDPTTVIIRIAKYDGQSLKILPKPDSVNNFMGGAGVLTVYNNALYGRCDDIKGEYRLFKITDAATSFSITGVTNVSCTAITTTKRRLTFTPQYTGLTGQPVSFAIPNETPPTYNPGPYTLNLYVDNPTLTLKATQTGTIGESSFVFHWLGYCPTGARMASSELHSELTITAIPNPSFSQSIDVEVKGTAGQPVDFQVVDEQGKPVSQMRIEQVTDVERVPIRLGAMAGTYILKISTSTQNKTIRLLKK